MNQTESLLQGHLSDMKGACDHICEALARQQSDSDLKSDSNSLALITRLHTLMERHSQTLKTEMERFGTLPTDPVKHAVSALTGMLAGLYDKVRSEKVSRMLRDDYVAFSLASVSQSMLHTTALAVGDTRVAEVALELMKQTAASIVELGEAVLPVVERETALDVSVQQGAAAQALSNVRGVWNTPT